MNISIDTRELTRYLNDFEQRQAPFALANTVNDVAKLTQYREREHIGNIFTVRRKSWVDNNVKITEFATKRKLSATVAIQSPGNASRSDILGKFESSTSKRPISGKSLAIPVDAKRNSTGIVPQNARPRAFNFKRVGGARMAGHASHLKKGIRGGVLRGALEVYEGDKRTVMIKNANGQGVILQRVGRGKRAGMRLLFTLTPKAKLTPNLKLYDTAKEAATHVAEFFRARLAEAMHSAR